MAMVTDDAELKLEEEETSRLMGLNSSGHIPEADKVIQGRTLVVAGPSMASHPATGTTRLWHAGVEDERLFISVAASSDKSRFKSPNCSSGLSTGMRAGSALSMLKSTRGVTVPTASSNHSPESDVGFASQPGII